MVKALCPNCNKKGKIKKVISGKFNVYFCLLCRNGFTYPVPSNIGSYYHGKYWSSGKIVGNIKDYIFYFFQKRRVSWVKKNLRKGKILDAGSGEGIFAKSLPKIYDVVSIEPPFSQVKNKSVIKKDFLKWKTNKKFDAICFWESLEHVPFPQKYLEKAYSLLKNKGKIFIEFPRYNSFESFLFGKNWFHLDMPRHLVHLTDEGIVILLERSGFKNAKIKSVLSLDYAPWGLTTSIINYFKRDTTDYLKKSGNFFAFVLFAPLTLFSVIIEVLFLIVNQSPIGLAVAEKNEKK